jgi:hypothetical protein
MILIKAVIIAEKQRKDSSIYLLLLLDYRDIAVRFSSDIEAV